MVRSTGNLFRPHGQLAIISNICYIMHIMNDSLEPRSGCIACAMAIIGTKWTALILRDVAQGPKRYSTLQQSIDINPRTLSQRLDMLTREGVVEQSASNYQLTRKGQDLIPILEQMAAWGDKYELKSQLV